MAISSSSDDYTYPTHPVEAYIRSVLVAHLSS